MVWGPAMVLDAQGEWSRTEVVMCMCLLSYTANCKAISHISHPSPVDGTASPVVNQRLCRALRSHVPSHRHVQHSHLIGGQK